MRRQWSMRLDERIVSYLHMVGLYHLAKLNETWFRLDKLLVSAFVERWCPKTHTFHMTFEEFTITLQDVVYQLGLSIDGHYISGCLTDFQMYIEGGRPAWMWFEEPLGVLPPANCIDKFAVKCSWFQETFGELPDGADEATVMRLEDMGGHSWRSVALSWLYQCMYCVANRHVVKLVRLLQLLQSWIFWGFLAFRPDGHDMFGWPLATRWSGHNPTASEKGPRFIWMPYSSHDIVQVVHPEILEPRHAALWRFVTTLIYFAVIEWQRVDRHLHWDNREDHVIRFDVVPGPGPSHEFLDWWSQHGRRFLSPELFLGDPKTVPIPVEATQRDPGRFLT
ncbi:serine/threonine-protein phosphatase 7 long form homolog [Arachis hypogaea]|uniref:serine/threonine-protein phosphatase 7 long form homolog n=1 Tax=Arachis hypogaea TaxID=3818 RepID=UPI003B20F6AA